jgi:arsenate reductase
MPTGLDMKKILFVCTGNSCRSQMAEGFGHEFSDGRFEVRSAGTAPAGVNHSAIDAMIEEGIDITDQTSDLLTDDMFEWADYVITLCNSARDSCTVIPDDVEHIHWDIENPDHDYQSEEDRRIEFARVRDELKEYILEFFEEFED